jgi:hypothetical protein
MHARRRLFMGAGRRMIESEDRITPLSGERYPQLALAAMLERFWYSVCSHLRSRRIPSDFGR